MILKEGPETVAAFIAEPVMGAGGVIVPPQTYFQKINAVCAKHDVFVISDEVICGFGRLARCLVARSSAFARSRSRSRKHFRRRIFRSQR